MPVSQFLLLVVDDEEAMRRSLAEILRLEGYQVETAPDGKTAISQLQDKDYDLLLLDLKMPGVDGIEVLRYAARTRPNTQVILLTAHGSLESAIEALRQGANDYLLKPASTEQILNSVQRGLERRTVRNQRLALLGQLEASMSAFVYNESDLVLDQRTILPSQISQGNIKESNPSDEDRSKPHEALDYRRDPYLQGSSSRMMNLGNDLIFDLFRRELRLEPPPSTDRTGSRQSCIPLSPNEGKLLEALIENMGHFLTHQELVEKIHGFKVSSIEAAEMLRPLISRLRRKLVVFPGGDHWIVSIRSIGYVFDKQ